MMYTNSTQLEYAMFGVFRCRYTRQIPGLIALLWFGKWGMLGGWRWLCGGFVVGLLVVERDWGKEGGGRRRRRRRRRLYLLTLGENPSAHKVRIGCYIASSVMRRTASVKLFKPDHRPRWKTIYLTYLYTR